MGIPRGLLVALVCVSAAMAQSRPAGLERIYVVPASHCDVGFTDTPSRVAAKRLATIEAAVDAADSDPAFRWTLEVGWDADLFLDAHGVRDPLRDRLRAAVGRGQISVGALYVNAHMFLMGPLLAEVACHLERCERELGMRPTVAILDDVPRAPRRLVDVLARRGVKALLWGPNDAFTTPAPLPRNRPFIWEGPDGGRVVTYICDGSYTNAFQRWLLDPPVARLFEAADARSRPDDAEATAFGIAREAKALPSWCSIACTLHAFDNWDAGAARLLPSRVAPWNRLRGGTGPAAGGPEIRVATPEDFFRDVEQRFHDRLEVVKTDVGGHWELVRAGVPLTTARLTGFVEQWARGSITLDEAGVRATVLAFDHNLAAGPPWPGMFDADGAIAHNREVAELTSKPARAAGVPWTEPSGARPETAASRPVPPRRMSPAWLDARDGRGVELRVAPSWLEPSFGGGKAVAMPGVSTVSGAGGVSNSSCVVDRGRFVAAVAGAEMVDAGWYVPLTFATPDLRWLDLPERERLRIGPDAAVLVVQGRPRLRLSTHPGFAWAIQDDPARPGLAALSGLVVRHGEKTTGKDGKPVVLSFPQLYPGEPQTFDAHLEIVDLASPDSRPR